MTALLDALIRLYQNWVSPLFGPRCRFYPSCSAYARGSIAVHGSAKGVLLAAWRLVRCHPWTPGGVDLVPPRSGPSGQMSVDRTSSGA